MKTYKIQRIFLENIENEHEMEDRKYLVPKERKGVLVFTEPFPWWSDEEVENFSGNFNQNLFWRDLKVSNWADFDHSEGVKEYPHFIPEILEQLLNLYQSYGYSFVSHAQGQSLFWGYQENDGKPRGQEITLVFCKEK